MLTGLGFSPFQAAAICLIANTSPVAFGAIGTPLVTLATVTNLPLGELSANVGKICAPISLFIPAYLMLVMGGLKALRAVLPAALVCGICFASTQFLVSTYVGPYLTDILASAGSDLRSAGAPSLLAAARCHCRDSAPASTCRAPSGFTRVVAVYPAGHFRPVVGLCPLKGHSGQGHNRDSMAGPGRRNPTAATRGGESCALLGQIHIQHSVSLRNLGAIRDDLCRPGTTRLIPPVLASDVGWTEPPRGN